MESVSSKEKFKEGSLLIQLHHMQSDGELIELKIDAELIPLLSEDIYLLSPYRHHTRDLIWMYVEEVIFLFPTLQEEINPEVSSVLNTLLIAMDYLTHERFMYMPFTNEHRNEIKAILDNCFDSGKTRSFSTESNRPKLNKATLKMEGNRITCLDVRKERTRIHMAVLFEKSESKMKSFHQVAHWLQKMNLNPDTSQVSYDECIKGKTNHDLHVDHLFYLNRIQRTLCWFINSFSWRTNELYTFDRIDLMSKLGIRGGMLND
jgi:hypothetical protein